MKAPSKIYKEKMKKSSAGMSLVEVLIGAAIILTSVASLVGVFGGLTSLSLNSTPKVQAAMLLDEGVEALRLMRDSGWTAQINSLSNGTTYYFIWQNSTWKATTTVQVVDSLFTRSFVLSAVDRDTTTHDIVTSGGAVDTGTRKATISVAWLGQSGTTTKSVETYLYNSYNN